MSNSDKLFESIRQESDEKIAAINADAEKEYNEVMDEARKKASDITHSAETKVQMQADNLIKAYKSREELERRNALLKTKRDEIEKTLKCVYDYILKLDDKKYFELVLRLAAKLKGQMGTVYFCSRDLKRLPGDFAKRLAECGVKADISKKTNNTISSGFILKDGDIEENMSFEAVINEKKEELEDLIGRELFKD